MLSGIATAILDNILTKIFDNIDNKSVDDEHNVQCTCLGCSGSGRELAVKFQRLSDNIARSGLRPTKCCALFNQSKKGHRHRPSKCY